MKATINGITIEGTAYEILDFIEIKESRDTKKHYGHGIKLPIGADATKCQVNPNGYLDLVCKNFGSTE